MNALGEVENRFPTAEWRVCGIPVWPLVRERWFVGEWRSHYTRVSSHGNAGLQSFGYVKRLLSGVTEAAMALWDGERVSDQGLLHRDLVFLSDGISFSRLAGKWVERFCDPLIHMAARSGLTSALWTPLHAYHRPRLTNSRFVQMDIDRANISGALRARAMQNHAHLPGLVEVGEWMKMHRYGNAEFQTRRIVSDGCRLRSIADYYRRHLDLVRPKLAFIVSYYSVEGMAFVLACRESGVPVVDIQHGVQGEMHPAYAAYPQPMGRLHSLVPDWFWVWSEWEAQAIRHWCTTTSHMPIVGGNPWLDVWQAGSTWDGVAEALTCAARLRGRAKAGRPVVLVTLQFGLADGEQLDLMAHLLRSAAGDFEFWIRLHPAMLERREEVRKRLATAGPCEIDESTDLPLQALLMHCDVHLTHSSSTVIDAAQIGVGSVITSAFGAELYAPLLVAGQAHVETESISTLVSLLANVAAATRRDSVTAPSTNFALSALLASAEAR
jgi:hypothetical protein